MKRSEARSVKSDKKKSCNVCSTSSRFCDIAFASLIHYHFPTLDDVLVSMIVAITRSSRFEQLE